MQTVRRFFTWYSDTFRKQKPVGKIVVGCVSFFVLCCLCSVPIGILNPATPTPEVKNTAPEIKNTAVALAWTTVAQTQVAMPTIAPTTTEAALPFPVATVTTFLSILPANNTTQTISTEAFTETPLPTLEPLETPTLSAASGDNSITIIAVSKSLEYVDIKNNGTIPQDLSGWSLLSETGNQSCPLSGTIQPGSVLRIFAQTSTDPGFYCGYGSPIWNNSKSDPAVLYNSQGKEVSRY